MSLLAVETGIIDILIAYPSIMICNAAIIQIVGFYKFFSEILIFIVGRNLALNLFPFLFRDRKHFQQSLEKEVKVVYRDVQKIDVTDKSGKTILIPIDDIYYCIQNGNFTVIHTLQHCTYTRLGSMKHLEQLLEKDFIRITPSLLLPFKYIISCDDGVVTMRRIAKGQEPLLFKLDSKNQEQISEKIVSGMLLYKLAAKNKNITKKYVEQKQKRNLSIPSQEKMDEILACIQNYPSIKSTEICSRTKHSRSTVGRCLAELCKQGIIKHQGSKKTGGYYALKKKL